MDYLSHRSQYTAISLHNISCLHAGMYVHTDSTQLLWRIGMKPDAGVSTRATAHEESSMNHDREVNISLQENINQEYRRQKTGSPAPDPEPLAESLPFRELQIAHSDLPQRDDKCFICNRQFGSYVRIAGRLINLRPTVITVPTSNDQAVVCCCKPCASWSSHLATRSMDELRSDLAQKWLDAAPLTYENYGSVR
jgi:hypothetical protein